MDAPPPPPPAMIMEQANPSPAWAADAVWYQIFPERFRNGAPQSDPRPEDIGANAIAGWRICPWGMEWYGRDEWEVPHKEQFFETVFQRRFGGDLVGLREQLPYLQKLGINAIYLNPVFWAPSLHKYDATAYHHIDPTLGPDRTGDLQALEAANETADPATWIWTAADRFFLELVEDIHSRGMRIILDGVFNHSGTHCFAFEDLKQNGKESPYVDWYRIHKWNEDGTFEHAGWGGHGLLPEFGRSDDTLNPGIKQYLFDSTRRWMDPSGEDRPSEGIDGWRLDVAYCVPHGFWKEWHAHVRSINPDAYTTGEIVGPAQEWIRLDEFDAVMNYEWLYPTISFFTPNPEAISASEFRKRIDLLHERHSPASALVQQNLLDSHDTGRILTLFESESPPFETWDPYFNWPKAADNLDLKTHRPGVQAKQALQLTVAWQMTGPGAPMIYYGTEVGMWGAQDPCDRQPMLWTDLPATDETMGFREALPETHRREPDLKLFAFYQRMIALRKVEPALRRGSFRWLPSPTDATLVYERELDGTTIRCLIHNGDTPISIPPLPPGAVNLWSEAPIPAELPPHSFLLVRLPSAAE